MVRPCDKNDRCGHTRGKKKLTAKPRVEECLLERYDISEADSGQHSKQGIKEEENEQSYLRPQMTGQVIPPSHRRRGATAVLVWHKPQ